MTHQQRYSHIYEPGAELLVIVTSIFILLIASYSSAFVMHLDQEINIFLSLAYALLLPFMSYLFSQAKQHDQEKAQIILIWMVFLEIIRICGDLIFTWRLRKLAEQLVRLVWICYLIYSYTSLNGIRVSLFILCVYFAFYEISKAYFYNLAKSSYLIGNNPNLINNYMKRTMLKDDIQTTPMNNCGYIVFGEENHEISVGSNGYLLGQKKSDSSNGVLTIGSLFQLNFPNNEVFTSANPRWRERDTCLSFALAKMLRRRFAKLSLDEANCKKALDFVLDGLIDYIGNNRDIQMDKNSKKPKPIQRVFHIIEDEVSFVSDFLQMKFPIAYFFPSFLWNHIIAVGVVIVNGVYLIFKVRNITLTAEESKIKKKSADFLKNSLPVDTTFFLFGACMYVVVFPGFFNHRFNWIRLKRIRNYIFDTANWSKFSSIISTFENIFLYVSSLYKELVLRRRKKKNYLTVLDIRREKILFCLDWSTILCLPKCVRRRIPKTKAIVKIGTNAKEAILMFLRKRCGRLTNGETSIKNHGMEHLNWTHETTTEVILIWHIATSLFHHPQLNKIANPINQEHSLPQSNDLLKKQQVALELSGYCHYLVACHPELLPDDVEWTKDMYEGVIKDVLDTDKFSDQNSIIGKGANLANDLMKCAEDGKQVWAMLADFWAEMILFIAPSDNVKGHKKILNQGELITQLWALLTHAGILYRPKPTEHYHGESSENNETTGGQIV